VLIKQALLSIFKRQIGDQRDREGGLETCDCQLQTNPDQAECRLIFRLNCRQGVVKTYRLLYEPGEILHASWDKIGSTNYWTASSRTLRDVVEYFGIKTEQLDWYFENGKVTFTSYTEKIQAGREILKQPMHTSVSVERKDFNDFNVQEGLHIGTMVKDFRSVVAHAETLRTQVTARYSRANRPMQISYGEGGLTAEFTLMTRGSTNIPSTATNASARPTPARDLSMRPASRPPETSAATSRRSSPGAPSRGDTATAMPPPTREPSRPRDINTQPRLGHADSTDSAFSAPSASIDPNSLFIPAENDDHQWDEPNFEEEPDIVTWDNTANEASASNSMHRIRDSELHSFASMQDLEAQQASRERLSRTKFPMEIAPTQRLSQYKGIFD
jgi:cell cycle checkpoint control protein RAD9A